VIGHALAFVPRPATRAPWDRAIAMGFAAGSACFFIGPFPGFVQLVGAGADGVVFFAGFLVSGALAYPVTTGPSLLPTRRDRDWSTAAVNLVGCVLFGVSAVASHIVPSSGSILDLAASNWCTVLGAMCFFIGALLVLPRRHAEDARPAGRPIVPKEV
jgi:hypothetical protein